MSYYSAKDIEEAIGKFEIEIIEGELFLRDGTKIMDIPSAEPATAAELAAALNNSHTENDITRLLSL